MRLLALLVTTIGWIGPVASTVAVAQPNERGWPIEHHDLLVRLEPDSAELRVVDRFRIRCDDRDADYHFLLHRDLQPQSIVLVDGPDRRPLAFDSRERWRPRDFWRRPDFRELGGFAIARQFTVAAPDAGWQPRATLEVSYSGAVYDSLHAPAVAYSRGFETTSGLVDPRGAYLHGETFWVPWSSTDRFTFELTTELPPDWDSVSQGRRVRRELVDGRRRTVWRAERPEESIYLVAGPYVVRERRHGETDIYAYTYANTDEATVEPYLSRAADYLDRYSQGIGPYPFAKWALVENWWQTGFGMPGFTLLGDRVIRLPFIVDTSYGHEILHCWWGNGVNVAYEEGNWCEGLTAYGADYQYKLDQSASAARDYRRDQLRAYLDFASGSQRDFALKDFRERSDFGTQAVGYGKSMMVFHMLEERLGPELFQRALAEFYQKWKFRSASWSDLRDVFSEVAGEDLDDWFTQWVQRPGALQVTIGAVSKDARGWAVELRQEPPYFRERLKIRWSDAQGEHVDRWAEVDGASTIVHLPPAAVDVEVDPDFDVYRLLDRAEVVPSLGQILGADSTVVLLGEAADPALRESLREVAESWSVNQDMRILEEAESSSSDLAGRSIYVLGDGAWARRVEGQALRVAREAGAVFDRARAEGHSVVACVRDPSDASIAWTLVLPQSPESAAAIGRKIPHYGRYSWLIVDAGETVDKGQWSLVETPMRRRLTEETE